MPRRVRSRAGSYVLAFLALLLAISAAIGSRPAADETVSVVFAGDIMVDLLPGEEIAKGNDPFADFAEILDSADLAVGNLECVVATKGKRVDKPWTFRAHPDVLKTLQKHFHAFSLANNHTGDFGRDAFLEQLDHLRKHKLGYFGGGKDSGEARTPWLVEKKGLRFAFLGYNDFQPRSFEAGPNWPGVAWGVEEQVVADIEAARTLHKADIVVPFMHWGWEEYGANRTQKKLARAMIDAGADLVVGGHPHVTQGAEIYKNRPIVYSLGNCVFDGFQSKKTRTGWFLRAEISKAGVRSWSTIPLLLDERGIPKQLRNAATPAGKAGDAAVRMEKFFPAGVQ
jgi:poly-gamma-glutamate capsule biosynthesis protein CapA/YwtB (metallophosphatase superfamily)